MRTFIILTLSSLLTLSASTGYIAGIIKTIGEQEFVITGVDHDKQETEPQDHKIPGKGQPVFILDGRLSTREATLKVGRSCFVFWNRHTQQMVVALSGADEVPAVQAPAPADDNQHTRAGIIVSGDPATETIVLRVGEEEVTVNAKKGKTGYILGTTFGAGFAETIVPGRRAVAFCYRNREFPNFVVAFAAEDDDDDDVPAENGDDDKVPAEDGDDDKVPAGAE